MKVRRRSLGDRVGIAAIVAIGTSVVTLGVLLLPTGEPGWYTMLAGAFVLLTAVGLYLDVPHSRGVAAVLSLPVMLFGVLGLVAAGEYGASPAEWILAALLTLTGLVIPIALRQIDAEEYKNC